MASTQSNLKELEAEFRKNTGDVDGAVVLAKAHLEAGNSNRAKEVLDKIIKADESAGAALVLRAALLAERHDWAGAERDYRMARRTKTPIPWRSYLKAAYFRWLITSGEGWRPNQLSRIATLVMCVATGLLLTAMGVRLLFDGAYLGFLLSFVMGLGFFWGGLMVGGVSLWLKALHDRLTPGWDETPRTRKKQ